MTNPTPLDDNVPDLVHVIDRAGHIENLFNQIIQDFCSPREGVTIFFWQVILDTSVMSFGAKKKVVMAIANQMKVTLPNEALMRVILLRNSFAHHRSDDHVVFCAGKTEEEDSTYHQFWTLDNNGVLRTPKRHEAFDQFNDAFRASKKALVVLRDLVKETFKKK